MRAFFTDLPVELAQAARMDGASEWQIFTKVMLPLVTSGIGALAVFTFLQNWNNFLVPLLYMPGGDYRR
jgi:ABC-type glycerol-3-phosphate transport system permease component